MTFARFNMYYWDEDKHAVKKARSVEILAFIPEADYDAYFAGRPYDEAIKVYRARGQADVC